MDNSKTATSIAETGIRDGVSNNQHSDRHATQQQQHYEECAAGLCRCRAGCAVGPRVGALIKAAQFVNRDRRQQRQNHPQAQGGKPAQNSRRQHTPVSSRRCTTPAGARQAHTAFGSATLSDPANCLLLGTRVSQVTTCAQFHVSPSGQDVQPYARQQGVLTIDQHTHRLVAASPGRPDLQPRPRQH